MASTSLGTTISNARKSGNVTATYYIIFTPNSTYSENGTITSSTYTSTATCTQDGNYVTAITVSTNPTVVYASFHASGGTKNDIGVSGGVRYHFSSGQETIATPSSTYGTLTFSTNGGYSMTNGNGFSLTNNSVGTVSAATKGTRITGETTSNTITKTVTYT